MFVHLPLFAYQLQCVADVDVPLVLACGAAIAERRLSDDREGSRAHRNQQGASLAR